MRRQQILDAALQCFLRSGYEATTIEDVRNLSGASVGSIYHHFADKHAIAIEIHRAYLHQYWRLVAAALSSSRSPRLCFSKLIADYLKWMKKSPDLFRFARFMSHSRGLRAEVIDAKDPFIEEQSRFVVGWFERHASAGRIKKMQIDMYDVLLMGPLYEYAAHWLQGISLTPIDEAAEIMASGVWMAFRKGT
ncbi:MAG: TetR/AcrR family transcriptional regulator [Actinomycetota bacterium]